jgi:GNAT superfamily N-acetyltransferase
MMRLTRFEDAAEFYRRAEPFLLEREADHNLILGICADLIQHPEHYTQPPFLAVLEEGQAVIAAAMMTPPHNLVLSHSLSPEGPEFLARELYGIGMALPGVNGPSSVSQAFVGQWQASSGRSCRLAMTMRIYQLVTVRPVTGVAGHMRRATEADRDLLLDWFDAFNREALGEEDRATAESAVDRFLHTGARGLYLWIDRQPVSMAGSSGPTPNGIRISAVYTPPECRRKGYASACVAALSQRLLDSGRKFCFLFADLSNPTSNKIYQDIGYMPVCDVNVYKFDPVEGRTA